MCCFYGDFPKEVRGEGGCFFSRCISLLWQSFWLNLETGKECKHKGQVTPPKRMNFLKSSKRPLNHPSFSENHVANFPSTSCSKSLVLGSCLKVQICGLIMPPPLTHTRFSGVTSQLLVFLWVHILLPLSKLGSKPIGHKCPEPQNRNIWIIVHINQANWTVWFGQFRCATVSQKLVYTELLAHIEEGYTTSSTSSSTTRELYN